MLPTTPEAKNSSRNHAERDGLRRAPHIFKKVEIDAQVHDVGVHEHRSDQSVRAPQQDVGDEANALRSTLSWAMKTRMHPAIKA